jgi:hypothetical protein
VEVGYLLQTRRRRRLSRFLAVRRTLSWILLVEKGYDVVGTIFKNKSVRATRRAGWSYRFECFGCFFGVFRVNAIVVRA